MYLLFASIYGTLHHSQRHLTSLARLYFTQRATKRVAISYNYKIRLHQHQFWSKLLVSSRRYLPNIKTLEKKLFPRSYDFALADNFLADRHR